MAEEKGGQAQTQEEFLRRGSMPTGPKDRLRSAPHAYSLCPSHCVWLSIYYKWSCSCALSQGVS